MTISALHARETFLCTLERDDEGRVLAVSLAATQEPAPPRLTRINSTKATRIVAPVHDILRAGGVTGRSWASSRPMPLDYLTGAQLELLLVAVRPLKRADRIERIGSGIAAMSREEASYWHAKLGRPGGLPALRVLLAAGS